jgi:hypothetical protein
VSLSLQKLPDGYPAGRGAWSIQVLEVDYDCTPMPWPCPVCGQTPDSKTATQALLELVYADRREERFIVPAHADCLVVPLGQMR